MGKSYFWKSAVLLIAFMMLLPVFVTGCEQREAEDVKTAPAESSASLQPGGLPQQAEAGAAGLRGAFEVQIFTGSYGDTWWKEMLTGFKRENPELNIVENMGPRVNEQMKTRWVSGNPPDFVYCDGAEGVGMPFARDGKLMDLKNFFDSTKAADGKSLRDHMIPGIIPQTDGKEYFAPYIFNAMALFYNDKLLKDNGISVPQNFDELLGTGEILKSRNIALLNYPGIYPAYLYQAFVQPALISEGGRQLWEDTLAGKPGVFTSRPYKNVITKVALLAQKGYIQKGVTALSHTQAQLEWLKGKSAFIANGPWVENEMKKDIPEGFIIQYNAAAVRTAGQKASLVGSSVNNAVAANAKNPEGALAFMAYIYREEAVKRFIEIVGMPVCRRVDISGMDTCGDMVKSCFDALADPEVQIVSYTMAGIPEVQKMWEDQLTSIVLGDITVDQYCENLEKEAARVLAARK